MTRRGSGRLALMMSGALLGALLAGCAAPAPSGTEAARTAPSEADARAVAARSAEALRRAAAELLFWPRDVRQRNFMAMETVFPGHVVPASGRLYKWATGPDIAPALGGDAAVAARMAESGMVGLMVLKDGRILLERYAGGFGPDKRWTSFSVAKSVTSTLLGAAVRDGAIASLDDPVTRYVPDLKGSAYEGVTVRQVLTMTSGVRWNENYADPASDVARMYAVVPPPGMDPTVAYLRTLPREAPPGTKWVYKTGETNLIGLIVTSATGKTLAAYLSEKIWKPAGMATDAFWVTDGQGQEIGGCCLSASLRDFARFGQFVLDGGGGVVPEGWFADATAPHASTGAPGHGYGYQWWTYPGQRFGAQGIFGQSILFDPATRTIAVTLSNWPTASDKQGSVSRQALLDDVVKAVTALESR